MADISLQGVNAYANSGSFLDNHLAQKAAKQPTEAVPETKVSGEASASEAIKNTQEQATEAKDTVEIKEPAKEKTEYKTINDILADMNDSLSKLSKEPSADDRKKVDEELKGLQKELQKFVGSYNDAMKYATSYGNEDLLKSATEMASRTDTYSGALQGIGVGVKNDNSLFMIQNQTAGERKAIQSLFGGNYSYGAKTRDTLADILKELNQGKTYKAITYDPMNVSGAE
jgi:DNA mismatch repair ATPase MutL